MVLKKQDLQLKEQARQLRVKVSRYLEQSPFPRFLCNNLKKCLMGTSENAGSLRTNYPQVCSKYILNSSLSQLCNHFGNRKINRMRY